MQTTKDKMMKALKASTIAVAICALAGCATTPTKPYTYENAGTEDESRNATCEKAKRDANLNNAMVEYIEKNKLANDPNWSGKRFAVPAECK